ncbi:MAG: HD domain-containing protein [bacterium]
MESDRLARQMEFLVEIDKLKQVLRRTITIQGDRNENSAEHSWHASLMALVLAEHAADAGLDLARAVKMMLLHDLVEIDAGDTYCYDIEGARDKLERETRAAERIFNLLPPDQASEVRALWDEFEAGRSPESRFANALDRLEALLLNYHTGGRTWRKHKVSSDQVIERALPIRDGSPALWEYARSLIDDAVEKGILKK